MSRTVRIAVARGGAVTVKAEGFRGEGCQPLVEELSARLKGTAKSTEHTAEFYEQADVQEQRQ